MKTHTLALALRLLKNGLSYHGRRPLGRPGRPQAVSLEITHRCLARCIMCNIWQIPREVRDLPVSAWVRLLSSNIFSDLVEVDITGGEPYLVGDLADLFEGICRLRRDRLGALRSVAITTNGLLTGRILELSSGILRGLANEGLDLVVVCAMDGLDQVHDRIRGYKGAFSRVQETIQGLRALAADFSNLIIGIKTTVLPHNVDQLEGLLHYATSNGLFSIISPFIITAGRYRNLDRAPHLAFSVRDIEKLIRFYETAPCQWTYHRDALLRYLKTGVMRRPCTCGFNYFFVRSNGDLLLCPLTDLSVGNVEERPVAELYRSGKASEIRRRLGRLAGCRHCTEPGLERYALPYEGFAYFSFLCKKGPKAFLEQHRHMGLDKYLG